MQQVKIYIETDSSSPKATEKHYGYVLEVMVSGQAVTREGFGKITGTYHQTVLTALAKALDRFNQSCEVCIRTEDDFVLNMLERNLAVWAGNEFLTSKRKPTKKKWTNTSKRWQSVIQRFGTFTEDSEINISTKMINISSDRPDRQRKLSWRGVCSIIAWEETHIWPSTTLERRTY